MIGGKCEYCHEEMKSPYVFRDIKGVMHQAHKYCCNPLEKMINDRLTNDIRKKIRMP